MQRQMHHEKLHYQNLAMANKLINTKSVISYDRHMQEFQKNSNLKSMISRGGLRAEQFSMLSRSQAGQNDRSINSARSSDQRSQKSARSRSSRKMKRRKFGSPKTFSRLQQNVLEKISRKVDCSKQEKFNSIDKDLTKMKRPFIAERTHEKFIGDMLPQIQQSSASERKDKFLKTGGFLQLNDKPTDIGAVSNDKNYKTQPKFLK